MDPGENLKTYAGRLATFNRVHHFGKRRASTAKKKAQQDFTWPLKSPKPEDLAHAGFYYKPSPTSHDSVTCFLCERSLDGWDEDDNPAVEHLSHVPDCGWAINCCIEQRSQDMDREEEDPLNEKMMESRRSTFQDLWPHEGKKGWKCKTEKMVAAGWCYAPLPEADDCVQCFYCGCSLDGWEPKDDPWQEHQKRAPECHFFTLVEESAKSKKQLKGKKIRSSRASKTSRASTLSSTTVSSEMPSEISLGDAPTEDGDTVLTTTSTTSKATGGRKKTTKAKTAPKKTRSTRQRQDSVLDESIPPNVSVVEDNHSEKNEPDEPAVATLPKTRSKRQGDKPADAATDISSSVVHVEEPEKPTRKVSRAKKPKKQQAQKAEDSSQLQAELEASALETQAPEEPRQTRGKKRTSDGTVKEAISLKQEEQGSTEAEADRPVIDEKHPVQAGVGEAASQNHEKREPEPIEEPAAKRPKKQQLKPKSKKAPAEIVAQSENIEKHVGEQAHEQSNSQAPDRQPTPPPQEPTQIQSASPQSSDAENHPPSSRPSSFNQKDVTNKASPIMQTATPITSPSKDNVIQGGLHSTDPWTSVDLEKVFLGLSSSHEQDNKENTNIQEVIQNLTSPEKKMSVEEWIVHNAMNAEEKLKSECERLISVFEKEGNRALRSLESVECA